MRNSKIVYSYDKETGNYSGEATAWESPLEPGIYHIPACATEKKPEFQNGKITKWNGKKWILENIPLPPEPQKPSLEELKDLKRKELAINRSSLAENSFIAYKDKTYSNSQNSRIGILSRIAGLKLLSSTADYITYPQKEQVTLSKADFSEILRIIEDREMDLRAQESKLKKEIDACKTEKKLEQIIIILN
jgi:hypothetical protein